MKKNQYPPIPYQIFTAAAAILPFLFSLKYGFLPDWRTWVPGSLLGNMILETEFQLFEHASSAAPYHFVSLFLHGLCAFFLFRVFRRFRLPAYAAVWFTLLWAWHPGRAENVACVMETPSVLCALFAILSLERFQAKKPILSALFLVGAILSRPWAIPLGTVLFLYALYRCDFDFRKAWKESWFPLLASLSASGWALLDLRNIYRNGAGMPDMLGNFFGYIGEFMRPMSANAIYPPWHSSVQMTGILTGLLAFFALPLVFILSGEKKRKGILFLIALGVMTLPLIGTDNHSGAFFSPNCTILVSAVFWCALGCALRKLLFRNFIKWSFYALTLAIAFDFLPFAREGFLNMFSNDEALFTRAAEFRDPAPYALAGLAKCGIEQDRIDLVEKALGKLRENETKVPAAYRISYRETADFLEKLIPAMKGDRKGKAAFAAYAKLLKHYRGLDRPSYHRHAVQKYAPEK